MALDVIKNFDEGTSEYYIQPIGEIDIHTSNQFKSILLEALEEKQSDLVVDGENLDYIDSTGLGVLISALKKSQEIKKEIKVVNLKPSIKKLFSLTSLDKVFKIEG